MKKINISDDIVPVAKFKTGISKYLKSLKETGHPLVITQNGRPAGVLITPSEYDSLTYQHLFTKSVNQGIKDLESGESFTTDELKEKNKIKKGLEAFEMKLHWSKESLERLIEIEEFFVSDNAQQAQKNLLFLNIISEIWRFTIPFNELHNRIAELILPRPNTIPLKLDICSQ